MATFQKSVATSPDLQQRDAAGRTLRDALRAHPAGPEVTAALGRLADQPPPASWTRWSPAAREAYLDAALDEARRRQRAGAETRET